MWTAIWRGWRSGVLLIEGLIENRNMAIRVTMKIHKLDMYRIVALFTEKRPDFITFFK